MRNLNLMTAELAIADDLIRAFASRGAWALRKRAAIVRARILSRIETSLGY